MPSSLQIKISQLGMLIYEIGINCPKQCYFKKACNWSGHALVKKAILLLNDIEREMLAKSITTEQARKLGWHP